MLHETRTGYSASYTYDTSGRRTSKTLGGNTENYTYSGGRLSQVGSTTFGYDANSRRTSMVTGSDTTSYGYDYEDRLTSVTPPGSSAITYVYNGLGSRVGRGSEEYRRAGASAGSPLLADGSASYTPGLSERRGGQSSFFHWGSFGDPSALSDGSGDLSDLYTSDWFLGIVGHTGSSPSPIGAGGGYVDPDTGGINHGGGGEYEPWLGGGPSIAPMILPENGNVNYGIDYGPPLDLLIIVSDFCAAWGDGLTWGGTGIVREGLGVNGIVNQDSAAYNAGDWISIGHGLLMAGAGAIASKKALGKLVDEVDPGGTVIADFPLALQKLGMDKYHDGPSVLMDIVYNEGKVGKVTHNYVQYIMDGSVNGTVGTWELGIENTIRGPYVTHWFFNPR
jgi:YD repeat-containing protein